MPDVTMPRLSDTMTEGVISSWLVHEGDTVRRGDILAEIETDKATMELEAYDSGVLTRIIAPEGSTVPIGQPIAVIGEPSQAGQAAESAQVEQPPKPAAAVHIPTQAQPVDESHLRATPLVRRLAREHDIDLSTVTGTGPDGRIVRADIDALINEKPSAASGVLVPTRSAPTPGLDGDERVPLTSIRRITAQRLTESAAAPHFYLTAVADVGALETLRAELNADRPAGASKISVTDLLIRACAVTLVGHPEVNSSWGGDHLIRHRRVNIGCAVAADAGLLVPVIADANHKSLTEIATAAHELIGRARNGRLSPAELSGGTFTISNLGMYDIESFTAVINPPEAAILAVGTVTEEAVVRDGQFAAASRMRLTLTVDHRVLDGAAGAAFLQDLVRLLEHPLRMLI
ncbi:2-oxo acid dehydrogenase subunit E2 [Mycobacterium sp. M1]|uniref:Dihydrolipoamide acetyltransferase component of pyruvate dehydrogenase complex n=1 Tax=Mycolicibacter acidiphilus TaxID=2835306 RepID=A0ABS5RKG5_9MYCO|nr:dihydrolipoamide acetyltransferase family protein [Mycolicibacter acidiphilus]MBS9534099.1 2-oxo acid dehydrogenase subunit E2 [Mycolicibacter acidiphilus]